MVDMAEAVAELQDEQRDLEAILRGLGADQWRLPTPAVGWDIRDQVAHLADTNEIAYDTASGGLRQLNTEARSYPTPEAFTEAGCDKGRAMEPEAVLGWWTTTAEQVNELLLKMDPKERVPWGLGMAARTLVTARLMEHWAHGSDIRGALGQPPNVSPRLRSIAWLVYSALPYAFTVTGVKPPPGSLRVEVAHDGELWRFGPEDADNIILGDALEFCRLGVQRMKRADARSIRHRGPLADVALDNLRAFL